MTLNSFEFSSQALYVSITVDPLIHEAIPTSLGVTVARWFKQVWPRTPSLRYPRKARISELQLLHEGRMYRQWQFAID